MKMSRLFGAVAQLDVLPRPGEKMSFLRIGPLVFLSLITLYSAPAMATPTVGELSPSGATLSFPISTQTVNQGSPVMIFTTTLTYPYTTGVGISYVKFMGNLNLTPGATAPTGVTYTWESSTTATPTCSSFSNSDPHTIDSATLNVHTPNHGLVGRLTYNMIDPTLGTLYVGLCLSVSGTSASVTINGNVSNNSLSVVQAQWKTKNYWDGTNKWAGAQPLEVLASLGITAPVSIPNNNTWVPVARAKYALPANYSLSGGALIPVQASGLQELQYQSGAYPESVGYQLQVYTSAPSDCTGSSGSQTVALDSSTNSYGMPFAPNADWDMKISNGFLWAVPSGGVAAGTSIYLQLCVEALSSDNNGNIVLKSISATGSGSATLAELFLPGNVTTYPSKYYPGAVELTNTQAKSALPTTWTPIVSGTMTVQSSLMDNTLNYNLQTDGVVVMENDSGTPGTANYRFQIGGNTGCTTNAFQATIYAVTVPPSSSGYVDVGINDLEKMGTTSPFVSSTGSCKITLLMQQTGGATIHIDPQATHFNSVLENDAAM